MTVRNFDSSWRTKVNQSRTLYGYYNTVANNATVKATGNIRTEQPSTQLNSVVIARSEIGPCSCQNDPVHAYASTQPFQNPVVFGGMANQGH